MIVHEYACSCMIPDRIRGNNGAEWARNVRESVDHACSKSSSHRYDLVSFGKAPGTEKPPLKGWMAAYTVRSRLDFHFELRLLPHKAAGGQVLFHRLTGYRTSAPAGQAGRGAPACCHRTRVDSSELVSYRMFHFLSPAASLRKCRCFNAFCVSVSVFFSWLHSGSVAAGPRAASRRPPPATCTACRGARGSCCICTCRQPTLAWHTAWKVR